MESLSPKVIHSGFWSLGGNWLSRGLGVIKLIILARLLSPQDFGIIGLAILSINMLNVFSETGIEPALIQKQKVDRDELDTAWTINIIRCFMLALILFLGSKWIAYYFDNPTLIPVLKVMALTFLLGGIVNIGIVFFEKKLEFNKRVRLDLISDFVGALVTILLAFLLRNVWALVLGSIAWGVAKCIGSYVMHPYRPKFRWDWPAAKNLLHFGKHIFWITLMTFIVTSGDDAIVGKVLGLTTLGFYTMAYNLANVPVSSMAAIVGKVAFPAYSLLQQDRERLIEGFGRVFETVMIILLPMSGLMFLLARDFTMVCLGEKWLPVIPAIKILCLFGLFRGIVNIFAALHLAVNRPDIQSKNKTIELFAFLVLVYPLALKWGLNGVCWGVTIVYGISSVINLIDSIRLFHPLWIIMVKALVFPLMLASTLMIIIWGVMILFPYNMIYWRLFLYVLISFLILGGALILFKKPLLRDFMDSF